MEGVEYVAENLPFTSAGYWWEDNRMNELIDSGADVLAVTKRVNGGTNGLADREHYYQRCLRTDLITAAFFFLFWCYISCRDRWYRHQAYRTFHRSYRACDGHLLN